MVDPFHRFLQKNQCFADISGLVPLLLFKHVIQVGASELRLGCAKSLSLYVRL